MTVKFTNNANSTLASGINSSVTSMTLADASSFPSLSGANDYCYLTLQESGGTTREIVKATARSSNTFTIVRGQDNTSAATWSSGVLVELRITSALLQDVIDGLGSGSMMDTDIFTGDGSDTTFTLSRQPDNENNLLIFIDGVFQAHNAYSVSGTTLTLSAAPANGRVITAYHMATTVGGSNLIKATMTGDNSDTTLDVGSQIIHENNVQVYFDGVYQSKGNYSVSGSVITFSTAPPTGVAVEAILNTATNISTATQLADADSDTLIQVEESADEDTIRMDIAGTEVLTLTNSAMTLKGTTPTLTIGDAGAEDTKIVFDGNAQDYYIGLDDSADDLVIGLGSAVGTTPAIVIDENLNVGVGVTPTAPLHVDGAQAYASSATNLSTTVSKAAFRMQGSSNASTSLFMGALTNDAQMYIQSSNGAGSAADDIVLNPFGGSVGIGVGNASPDRIFHAKRSDSGGTVAKFENSAGTVYIELNTASQAGGDAGYFSYDSNKKLGLWTDDTQHVTIDANGKVGINDASPFAKLHAEDTSWSSGSPYGTVAYIQGGDVNDLNWGHLLVSQSGTSTDTGGRISLGANGENPIAGIRAKYKGATYGDLALLTRPSGGTNTERLVIRSDGTVGIGTDTADTYLDIEYSSTSQLHGIHLNNQQPGGYGSALTFISKRSDNSATEIAARIKTVGANSWNSNATESTNLVFETDYASTLSERMMLNFRGALKVRAGDSLATYASSTDYTHEIWQDQAGYAACKIATSGGTTNQYGAMFDFADDVSNTSNWFLRCMANTDSRLYIYSNGDVYTKNGTSIQQSSDRRLKDNIADYSGGLTVLKALTPRTYTWKEGQGAAGTQYGFVAQEIEEASEVEDNMNLFSIVTPQREDDKNPLQPDDKQYNTQLGAKDALYISAIQELSKEIETLKAEVKALKEA